MEKSFDEIADSIDQAVTMLKTHCPDEKNLFLTISCKDLTVRNSTGNFIKVWMQVAYPEIQIRYGV